MFSMKKIVLSAVTAGLMGTGAAAARADGYVVSRIGPTYGAPVYAAPIYATPGFVPACPPVIAPPACEPPVVIYQPQVIYRDPIRIFHPLDRDQGWNHRGENFRRF